MASLNHENQRGSGKNLKVHFELPEDEDRHSSYSISSKSSVDSDIVENNAHSRNNPECKCAEIELPKSTHSTEYNYPSPVWSYQGGSIEQSPPFQMMSQPGYDPNRIPMSVFYSKPVSPLEWSLVSNESLFSLQMGNNSFSRDHFFALNKSEELSRPDDFLNMSMTLPPVEENELVESKNDEMDRHSVSTETSEESIDGVMEKHCESIETPEESIDGIMEKHCESIETSAETEAVVLSESSEVSNEEAKVLNEEAGDSTNISFRSEESTRSMPSFQFPVLAGVDGRASSVTVESDKRASSVTVESDKRASSVAVESDRRASSVTVESEKQERERPSQPLSPKVEMAPKRGRINWFCCSCWPCF